MIRYKSLKEGKDPFPLFLEFMKDYRYEDINHKWIIKKGYFLKKKIATDEIGYYQPTKDFGTYVLPKKDPSKRSRFLDIQISRHDLANLIKSGTVRLSGANFREEKRQEIK